MYIFETEIFGLSLTPSYYGLMYVLAFTSGYFILWYLKKYSQKELESLFFLVFLGVFLGGRLGFAIFYNPSLFIDFRSEIPFWGLLAVHEGGMSFHGGLIGVIIMLLYFSKRYKKSYLDTFDTIAPLAALGIFFGRIGNYINKELLGFPYEGFLAVQTSEGSFFPSPLFQAFTEGFLLFLILCYFWTRRKFSGQIETIFLIGYGIFRTFTELFIRMPDTYIGYHFGFLTHGSLLSIPMIFIGTYLYIKISKK
ncbi:prolipoprotein diacylglyceryl transferase [Candidatus Gracilibacteria bacterium]|nr:prolipoprotein diacylglyceryl transferase [Candidatus Gracilibacteria bacterium]